MTTSAQKRDRMDVQVTVSHLFLEESGLTPDQLAKALLTAMKNARHPVSGAPIELPKGAHLTLTDDQIPLSLY